MMAGCQANIERSSRRCGKCCRRRRMRCHPSRPLSCAHEPSMKLLRQWMKRQARFKNSLVPAAFPDTGRGLMTKKSVGPGQIILSLPQKLLITTKTVLNSDIGQHIKRWKPKLSPQQCLAVYLIWERHKQSDSPWFPYINMLPMTFTSPAYCNITELSFLPKSARKKAYHELDKLNISYREVNFFSKHHWHELYDILSFDIYKWAWYAINSRSVFYEVNPCEYLNPAEADNLALAPFLDLLNHHPRADINAGYNADTDCYEITTFDSYKPYDQVFISYGNHSNQTLFIEYGFCVPNNPNDVFEVSHDDVMNVCEHFSVKYLEKKLDLLQNQDLLKNLVCTIEGLSWNMLTVFKTLAMEWRHLQQWNQIFTETDIFDELTPLTHRMISYVLKPYLTDNIQLQKDLQAQNIKEHNPVHLEMIGHILKVENSILTSSIPV